MAPTIFGPRPKLVDCRPNRDGLTGSGIPDGGPGQTGHSKSQAIVSAGAGGSPPLRRIGCQLLGNSGRDELVDANPVPFGSPFDLGFDRARQAGWVVLWLFIS